MGNSESRVLGHEHGVVAEAFGSAFFGGYFATYNAFEQMFLSI